MIQQSSPKDWSGPELNMRSLVYNASGLTTSPRRTRCRLLNWSQKRVIWPNHTLADYTKQVCAVGISQINAEMKFREDEMGGSEG